MTITQLEDVFAVDDEGTGGVVEAQPDEAAGAFVVPEIALASDIKDLLTRGIRRRRSAPIMGYVGLNGQGKSLAMIRDTLPSLMLGRRVLSTVALLDPHTGNPHPLYVPFRSWHQLDDFRNGDVLLDEVTGVADARDSGLPKKVRRLLPQMRRANVMVRWTGIDWDNSDRRLRQLTQAVCKARGFAPNRRLQRQDGQKDALSMWAPNRGFLFTTFDAQTLSNTEDSAQLTGDTDRKKRAKVLSREIFWAPGSIAFRCYNTLDSVAAVDSSCEHCGGRIAEKYCKGH